MADNTAISTVYNHFLTTYAPQGTNTKYDTHKKSELRGLYNSIVKMNKEAPLFLLDTSPATQEFAVGLKENARSLKNVISSLSMDDSDNMPLKKKDKSAEDDSKVSNYKDVGDESAKSADKTDTDKSAKSTDKTGSDESVKSDDNTGSDGSTKSVDKDSENESANSADNKNSDAVIKSSYKDIDEIYKKLNGTTNNDKKDNNNFGKMLNSNKEEDWFKKLTKTDDDVDNSLEKIFEKRKNGGN